MCHSSAGNTIRRYPRRVASAAQGFPKQRGVCRLDQFSIDASSFKWRRSFRYMHGDPLVRRLVRNQVERASRRGFELRRRAAAKYHGTSCSSEVLCHVES